MPKLFHMLWVFALLSILAVGGGTAVLPEMQNLTVHYFDWLTDDSFRDLYSLGQVSPGPNMLMVLAMGYRLAGAAGAVVAGVGFFLPDCVLTLAVNRLWNRVGESPWRLAVQRGLAPLAIGLMASGTFAIARLSIVDFVAAGIATGVFAILMWRHVNAGVLVLTGGTIYLLASR